MTAIAPVRAPTPRLMNQTTSRSTTALSSQGQGPAAQPQTQTQTPTPTQAQSQDSFAPAPAPAQNRHSGRSSADQLSDKATSAFIRRTLCSQHLADKGRSSVAPIDELLPPLTSRNDVDLQLYAILAVILKEFVQAWYSKITPDETFVGEIVQIIAHCTRALEQRLRKVDLESLLFDEIPDLLDKHITAYRASRNPIARPPTAVNPHDIYHSLCPLPLLSPVPDPATPETIAQQQENEMLYRQMLAQGVLAVLLPTEDLQNPCLTSLVGQILSEMVMGNIIANKASQPWLILEGLSILANVIKEEPQAKASGRSRSKSNRNQPPKDSSWSMQRVFLSMLHWIFLVLTAMRLFITSLVLSSSFPSRSSRSTKRTGNLTSHGGSDTKHHGISLDNGELEKVPVVSFRIWACASRLIEMDSRMPWLGGSLSMLQLGLLKGPGQIANVDGIMDRLASHFIHKHVLDPARLPPLLRALRGAVFPNNAPGTPTMFPPSSDAEMAALRRKCAVQLASLMPAWMTRLYFRGGRFWRSDVSAGSNSRPRTPVEPDGRGHGATGATGAAGRLSGQHQGDLAGEPDEVVIREIEDTILDVFSDEYCNKHLMYIVVELVLVRLVPELAEKRVTELWDERLS